MPLNEQEEKALRRLMRKKDEPAPAPVAKTLNISMDIADEKQVERARKLGLLDIIMGDDDDDEGDDKENDDDDEPSDDDDTPKRRGYFGG